MKKVLALLVLVSVVFIAYNRNRLFIRDPLGSITRDGVKEDGAQVYINFPNDVLLENDRPPMYAIVVQHGNHVGEPKDLHCMHYMACLLDADVATLNAPMPNVTVESMTSKEVRYRIGKQQVVVGLR